MSTRHWAVLPVDPPRAVRAAQRLVDGFVAVPGLRRLALSPVVARPGYWVASALALVWGGVLGLGRVRRAGGVVVASRLPRWAFGRGGTTVGAVFLTHDLTSEDVLAHEAVHREQWRRYGLAFIPLYIAAGVPAHTNRFEVEAGLERGGYR